VPSGRAHVRDFRVPTRSALCTEGWQILDIHQSIRCQSTGVAQRQAMNSVDTLFSNCRHRYTLPSFDIITPPTNTYYMYKTLFSAMFSSHLWTVVETDIDLSISTPNCDTAHHVRRKDELL